MAEKKESKSLLVYNNGERTISLKAGPKGEKRILVPGASIEALDEKEFKHLTGYRDISDAIKMVPSVADKMAKLEQEKADLQAELAEMKKSKGK